MGQHAHIALGLATGSRPCAQRVPEPTFVLADRALDVPAPACFVPGKLALHLESVRRCRFGPRPPTVVYRDHGAGYTQLLSAQTVMCFRVVGRVRVESVDRKTRCGLPRQGRQEGRFISRAVSRQGRREDMALVFAGDSKAGIRRGALGAPLAAQVVGADVSAFQPRGVQGDLRLLGGQSEFSGPLASSIEQIAPKPLFSRRCWTF